MSAERKPDLHLEIAHVLFMDVVGFSKLLINDQSEILEQLNQLVRDTPHFREAEAAGKLIRLSTGDGMALVFSSSAEAPVECALEISKALQSYPQIQLRMGVHSGPVNAVSDVNDRSNVTGAGINTAQRVMDCGDAGHILLSRHVAEDLEQYRQWQPCLHDLGECEVKHGIRVHVVNLYTQELGNPEPPEKFAAMTNARKNSKKASTADFNICLRRWIIGLLVGTVLVVAALALYRSHRDSGFLQSNEGKGRSSVTAAVIPEKSIAVLPFENLSDEKQNAYFADGVQDEILTDLAKIAALKVISRSSVMHYKSGVERNLREIGKTLGVAHLLEGSVQRANNRIRVNAQLIDARTDAHLWAQTYDRDLADIFAIQSEIAKAIADQLQAKLSPNEKAAIEQPPTTDLAAFDLYARAKTLLLNTSFTTLRADNLLQAVDLLNQAIARDPNFLLAYCQLADGHDQLYFSGGVNHTPARLASAEAAVQTALRLAPDAGETHLAVAQHRYRGYRDFDGARAELTIAQRALPNNPAIVEFLGYIDRRQGHWETSTRELERAIELDPRNLRTLQQIALSYQYQRQYDKMAVALDRALAIAPKSVESRVARAAVDFRWRADTRPLHSTIDAILAEDPSAASILAENWMNLALVEHDSTAASRAMAALSGRTFGQNEIQFSVAFGEGLMARIRRDSAAARAAFTKARTQQEALLRTEPDYGPALCVLGLIDAALGRKDEALREGQRAIDLIPISRDAVSGSEVLAFYAVLCAWAGEKDLALAQLEILTRIPCFLTYGHLRLQPFWDPLRGDSRFEKIVASLAPRAADK